MQIIEQVSDMRQTVQNLRCSGKRIGFVATMGALHEGHLQLIKAAASENDITVCSIFINPTQFNNSEDFKLYPRTLDEDIALLETVSCDYLFAPDVEEIYPQQLQLQFSFGALEAVMEGGHRPGHFNGVATIVSKLFHIVQPHKAYFGQKDLQQVAIIRQLVQSLNFDLEVVCYPIIREADGLAMSSRNRRLIGVQRQTATNLYKALLQAKNQLKLKPLQSIQEEVAAFLAPLEEVKLEYFEIADCHTLQPLQNLQQVQEVALFIAAYVGQVRLIDNIIVNLNEV